MTYLEENIIFQLKENGVDAKTAFNNVKNILKGDTPLEYDLGSYTTTKMLPEANDLILENIGKNIANKNEYIKTTIIHNNLIKIISRLLNNPNTSDSIGTSTSGSSEAIFLAILAAKFKWKKKNLLNTPNIVLCSNAHFSWFKFAKHLDVEVREVPLTEIGKYPLENVLKKINENTICVVAILGCTYLGTLDSIKELNNSIEVINNNNKWNVYIHIDAAIGGFVVPFLKETTIHWDFQLSLVNSINISSHKYGLVYPGLGWILFKHKDFFPPELNSKSEYLSGVSESQTISYSRSASLVIAQYFNFLHYGEIGYQKNIQICLTFTKKLTSFLNESSFFEVISNQNLPVVVFKFKKNRTFDEKEFTSELKINKWILPYYRLSRNLNDTVMRIVIRNDMTENRLKKLMIDLVSTYKKLSK